MKVIALCSVLFLSSVNLAVLAQGESDAAIEKTIKVEDNINLHLASDLLPLTQKSIPTITKGEANVIVDNVIEKMRQVCSEYNLEAYEKGGDGCGKKSRNCLLSGDYYYRGARINLELQYENHNWNVHILKFNVSWTPAQRFSHVICIDPKYFPIIADLRKTLLVRGLFTRNQVERVSKRSNIDKIKKDVEQFLILE